MLKARSEIGQISVCGGGGGVLWGGRQLFFLITILLYTEIYIRDIITMELVWLAESLCCVLERDTLSAA